MNKNIQTYSPKNMPLNLLHQQNHMLNKGWFNVKNNKYFKSSIAKYNDTLPCYICNILTHISNIASCKIIPHMHAENKKKTQNNKSNPSTSTIPNNNTPNIKETINIFILCNKCNFENHDVYAPDTFEDVLKHKANIDAITCDTEYYYKLMDEENSKLLDEIHNFQEMIEKKNAYLLILTKENQVLNANFNIELEKNNKLRGFAQVNTILINNIRRQQIDLHNMIESYSQGIKQNIAECHKSMIETSKGLFDIMDDNFNKLIDIQDLSNPKSAICHICNVFNINVVLSPCRHTLCSGCLKNIKSSNNNADENNGEPTIIHRCPYCRQHIESNEIIFI